MTGDGIVHNAADFMGGDSPYAHDQQLKICRYCDNRILKTKQHCPKLDDGRCRP